MNKQRSIIVGGIFLFVLTISSGIYLLYRKNIKYSQDQEGKIPPTTTEDTELDNSTNTGRSSTNNLAYALVDTGQTICTDSDSKTSCPDEGEAFYGQDAQYLGNEFTYEDNGDGTITDVVTGLIWQQDSGEKVDYYDAIQAVESFELAGYDDWRVPTIKELYSLMNFMGTDPASVNANESNLTAFLDEDTFVFRYGVESQGDRLIDSQWVTSSIYKSTVFNGQECFFGVNFADGRIKCYPTDAGKGYYAIYVRGEAYGQNDFQNNGDGTITDKATGLMWQQDDSGESMDWESSLSYCEDLNLAGYDDWRLPNAKELQSIVDYSRSPDTTASAAIDPVFNITQINNEAGQTDYPYFWTSTTHILSDGNYGSAAYISFGRALGYMNNQYMDVHGAGAQRSDPKAGDPAELPVGRGPQGDVQRILNYARCVRGG